MFAVLEGIDGSGKTTTAKLVTETLRCSGFDAVYTSEPSTGPIGQFTRTLLVADQQFPQECYGLLIAADRMHHIEYIKKELSSGRIVICDRYIGSALAYNVYDNIDIVYKNIPQPDLTFFVDVPLSLAKERLAQRGKCVDCLEKELDLVYQRYQSIAQQYIRVDGTRSTAQVCHDVLTKVLQVLGAPGWSK